MVPRVAATSTWFTAVADVRDDVSMARLAQIVIDCELPALLARFWASALDGFEVRPYDDAEVARLGALGFTPETDPTVIVDGPRLELCFQRVDDAAPTGKRRLHLDVAAPVGGHRDEVDRLVALGAAIVQGFDGHTWMCDPEGNDFCVTIG